MRRPQSTSAINLIRTPEFRHSPFESIRFIQRYTLWSTWSCCYYIISISASNWVVGTHTRCASTLILLRCTCGPRCYPLDGCDYYYYEHFIIKFGFTFTTDDVTSIGLRDAHWQNVAITHCLLSYRKLIPFDIFIELLMYARDIYRLLSTILRRYVSDARWAVSFIYEFRCRRFLFIWLMYRRRYCDSADNMLSFRWRGRRIGGGAE